MAKAGLKLGVFLAWALEYWQCGYKPHELSSVSFKTLMCSIHPKNVLITEVYTSDQQVFPVPLVPDPSVAVLDPDISSFVSEICLL